MVKRRVERRSWTRIKPTVAGWYWYRGAYDVNPAGIQKEPVVVFVETARNGQKKRLQAGSRSSMFTSPSPNSQVNGAAQFRSQAISAALSSQMGRML